MLKFAQPIVVIFTLRLLQILTYHDLPYRQDEVWRVYPAVLGGVQDVLRFMVDVNAPFYALIMEAWVPLAGHTELATRHLSVLLTMLTIAWLYRLAANLYHSTVPLLAVLIFVSFPLTFYYTQDASPYVIYLLVVIGSTDLFLRLLATDRPGLALAYTLMGIVGLYNHYFFLFTLMTHAIVLVFFSRVGWAKQLRLLGVQALIVACFSLGWGLSTANQVLFIGDLNHGFPTVLGVGEFVKVLDLLTLLPILWLLLAGPLGVWRAAAVDHRRLRRVLRWEGRGLPAALFVTSAGWLALLFALNSTSMRVLTDRNLFFVLPPLMLLAAAQLRDLPRPYRLALLAVLFLPLAAPIADQRPQQLTIGWRLDVQTMVAFFEQHPTTPRTTVYQHTTNAREFALVNYYLENDILGGAGQLIRVDPGPPSSIPIPTTPHIALDPTHPDDVETLRAAVAQQQTIWHVVDRQVTQPDSMANLYEANGFGYVGEAETWRYKVQAFRAVPPANITPITYGEIVWTGWQTDRDTVARCGSLEVLSRWRVADETEMAGLYSANWVLSGADGVPVAGVNQGIGAVPSSVWPRERDLLDLRRVAVPCDAPPGDYALVFNVLRSDTGGQVVTGTTSDGTPTGDIQFVTSVRVSE